MTQPGQLETMVRMLMKAKADQDAQIAALAAQVAAAARKPRSPQEEIDAIPGRRMYFAPTQTQTFTTTQSKTRAAGVSFIISQDGPFVMTHFPTVMCKITGPTTATGFGTWGVVVNTQMPTQQALIASSTNNLYVWLSYELQDAGSGRNLQDNAVPGSLVSYPGQMIPLPMPTLFAPGTTITFTPTYELLQFDTGVGTPGTTGSLVVSLVGYKIINGA